MLLFLKINTINISNIFIRNIFSKRFQTMSETGISYLSQKDMANLDQDLLNICQFSVDQLMELAGLSVAISIYKSYPPSKFQSVLVCCGPGNNGGDGLVAARHLSQFGYKSSVYYPKPGNSELFGRLVKQCKDYNVTFTSSLENIYSLFVDALFGFSFKPPVRPQFREVLDLLAKNGEKLISIDIPSGWDVDNGPLNDGTPLLQPDCLISLTAPKLCSKFFLGKYHWLGGRFVPNNIKEKYSLKLPPYLGCEQVLSLSDLPSS